MSNILNAKVNLVPPARFPRGGAKTNDVESGFILVTLLSVCANVPSCKHKPVSEQRVYVWGILCRPTPNDSELLE